MAEFYDCFYQRRREDTGIYTVGAAERVKKESVLKREYLCRLFAGCDSEEFDEVLKNDKSWWSFYHLSEMRKGLFAWYDFKENARLLEVEADFGALTGGFCDRCHEVVATESSLDKAHAVADRYKNRNNLKVFAGAVEDFDYTRFSGYFDYIVLYDVLERKGYGYSEKKAYKEYLKLMQSLLKQDGKILLVATNRYGIKYLCGARDKFTGKPFDGINHYPDGTEAYAFEKGELEDLLKESGIKDYKFYYPLPDARMPQIICTDANLGRENIVDRITFYDVEDDTLIARERCLYEDFMRNNVFGYFSNSFFVEITMQGKNSDIDYAIVSSDRGRERSFATVIYSNGIVRKKPIYKEGEKIARKCVENIERLEKRGIHVIRHELCDNCIEMPYMEGITLAAELRKAAKEDRQKFYKLFDLLYNDILKSSEYRSQDYTEETGPILKECYFDMVPSNCFYVDGDLQFFDQEFVKYDYPAKYTLFRAIKYMYMSMWELEDFIPKQELIQKYKLESLWDEFEKAEDEFIALIRNKQINSQLDSWSYTDEKKIYKRGDWLQLSNYNPDMIKTPVWLQKVQTVQLRLLKKVIEICDKYNLRYYAYYGTLLGAVRHRGFVPWDDDTDIVMPRTDYDRFLEVAAGELNDEFFLQTPLSDRGCFYGGYSRLRYTNSTAIEIRNWKHETNHGIWMDIQPLDYVMPEQKAKEQFCDEMHEIQRMILAKVYGENDDFLDMSKQQFSEYKEMSKQYSYEELLKMLKQKIVSIKNTGQVAILASYHLGNYREFPEVYFGRGIKLQFEEFEITVPNEYEKILAILYGGSYNSIPPLEKQKQKHEVFLNADIPYMEYIHKFMDILEDSACKEYIIVGTSELADTFIDRNYKNINISFVVDNAKNEDTFWGYPIKELSEIHLIPQEKRKIVICERYFREWEELLKSAGIYDYYIYIHEKWWLMDNNA